MKCLSSLVFLGLLMVGCEMHIPPPDTTTTVFGELRAITLVDGKPEGGVVRIEVEVGDEVHFVVNSDRDDELHVHGLDHTFTLSAGVSTDVRFNAAAPGIFEIETHRQHSQVVELVVGG